MNNTEFVAALRASDKPLAKAVLEAVTEECTYAVERPGSDFGDSLIRPKNGCPRCADTTRIPKGFERMGEGAFEGTVYRCLFRLYSGGGAGYPKLESLLVRLQSIMNYSLGFSVLMTEDTKQTILAAIKEQHDS